MEELQAEKIEQSPDDVELRTLNWTKIKLKAWEVDNVLRYFIHQHVGTYKQSIESRSYPRPADSLNIFRKIMSPCELKIRVI